MKRRLLLDIVVGQGAAILELLAGEDEALLVWWDSLLVLDFGFYVVDGVRGLDFKGDGLPGDCDKKLATVSMARWQGREAKAGQRTGLDENLHDEGVGGLAECAM